MKRLQIGDVCFGGLHILTKDNVMVHKKTGKLRCKSCVYAYKREEYKNQDKAERLRNINRSLVLKKTGWTLEMYNETHDRQKGKCAICGKVSKKRLHADHKHSTPPFPRGLLCGQCNPGLGMFLDSLELLAKAILYLKKHEEAYERNRDCR